jgi:hypothetical protein
LMLVYCSIFVLVIFFLTSSKNTSSHTDV